MGARMRRGGSEQLKRAERFAQIYLTEVDTRESYETRKAAVPSSKRRVMMIRVGGLEIKPWSI